MTAPEVDTVAMKETLLRWTKPTTWHVGDRVRAQRSGAGEVLHIENATGALDGIQLVAWVVENGTVYVSLGGELEADAHTERCLILRTTEAGCRPTARCGCPCHGLFAPESRS